MIRLHGITKSFAGGRHALRGIDLHVAEGEFAVLTGPLGSGKSTLIRLLLGEIKPTTGRIVLMGRNFDRLKPEALAEVRRDLGLVFDDPRLMGRLSVLRNVALAAEVAGETRDEAERLAVRALDRVGVAAFADCLPRDLSQGERQLVSLARALVNSPSLIIADEPMLHLDAEHAEAILRVLADACSHGATVLLASHNLTALSSINCRILMMAGGRMFEDNGAYAIAAL